MQIRYQRAAGMGCGAASYPLQASGACSGAMAPSMAAFCPPRTSWTLQLSWPLSQTDLEGELEDMKTIIRLQGAWVQRLEGQLSVARVSRGDCLERPGTPVDCLPKQLCWQASDQPQIGCWCA